jgi:hypothetical protein
VLLEIKIYLCETLQYFQADDIRTLLEVKFRIILVLRVIFCLKTNVTSVTPSISKDVQKNNNTVSLS